MTQPDRFVEGRRARIGVVVPSINTVVEPWFARAVPDGVSVHTSRMLLAPQLTRENVIEMDRTEGVQAIRQIATCRPASIAYCCTASSVIQGQAYDERLREEIEHESGAKATTATHAILSSLAAFGATRVAIASPYTDEVDALEHHFFEAAGLDVVGSANLGISDTFRLAEPDAEALTAVARRAWKPDADALIITCLNTRSHFVVEAIEREIGKPVVTSTTATLWHALRLAGVGDAIPGYGQLLSRH
jgi:maleate isomerase